MAKSNIILTVNVAWWFIYIYLPALKLFLFVSRLIGSETVPNKSRVRYWLGKATTFKHKPTAGRGGSNPYS